MSGGTEKNALIEAGDRVVDDDDRRIPRDLVISDTREEVQQGNGGLFPLTEMGGGRSGSFDGVVLRSVGTKSQFIATQEASQALGEFLGSWDGVAIHVFQSGNLPLEVLHRVLLVIYLHPLQLKVFFELFIFI